MSVGLLKRCLEYIAKQVYENPGMSEDDLYSVFDRSKFFECLGYERFGVEIRKQFVIVGKRKKADYVCLDEYQNAIFVIEAKKPSDKAFQDALGQLWERYVLPLKARYGVLTNGRRIIIYQRIERKPEFTLSLNLAKVTQKGCEEVFRKLRKPEYDITLHSKLEEYFSSVEKLSLKTGLAKEVFFEAFKLEKSSAFGLLLSSLVNLFEWIYPKSRFLKGAYGFWQKSLAREPREIPESWEAFLEKERDVFRFMFCLETAHALLARLILAKACEDLDFPGINVSNFTLQKIHQVRGQIPIIAYPVVLVRLMKEMRDQLVYSIFEEDIFGWWTDGFEGFMEKSSSELLQESLDESLEDFSEAIAGIILMLYKFDFGEVAGDPLGDLYQQYFDKDTRKALGEFYTPVEVVNYILDVVRYENIGYGRLLDPACGSGTFIVEALKRYLTEVKGKAKQHGWAYVLRELCNSPKIVGFDIHPFACLIARTRFMLELIPYFKKALEEEAPRIFYLQRIPVFRTDSLATEMLPPEFEKQRKITETEEDIIFPVTLPMRADSESSISASIILPSWRKILSYALPLYNLDEYFCTLQAMFDAIKSQLREKGDQVPEPSLRGHLREYLKDKDFAMLANFFQPYTENILKEIRRLQSKFQDGRLIKTIEDTVLAALLKNYFRYDFVVSNPPYIHVKRLPDKLKTMYRDLYSSAMGKFDAYVLFMERAINWLTEGGLLGFIVSNKFVNTDYGKGIRRLIVDKSTIERFIDFGDTGIFEDVTNYPCILILSNTKDKEKTFKCVKVMKPKANILEYIEEHIITPHYENEFVQVFVCDQATLGGKKWVIAPQREIKLLERLRKTATHTLEQVSERICQGLWTGRVDVFADKITQEFIEKHKLEREIVLPVLRGGNLSRWKVNWNGRTEKTDTYIIYPYKITSKGLELVDIERYPNVHSYLLQYKSELEKRKNWGQTIVEAGKKWYEIWHPSPAMFEPKILIPDTAIGNNFVLDESGRYLCLNTCYAVILKDVFRSKDRFIVALLNSKTLEFYFKHISPFISGGYYKYKTQYLNQLPIKLPRTKKEEKIVHEIAEVADKILNRVDPNKLLENFPDDYVFTYRAEGVEFYELQHSFNIGHKKLEPFMSGLPGKGYVVYPIEGEDSIWVDTREKAQYLVLALRNRKVKQNETVKILIPRDNSIVTEILKRVKKTIREMKATPIDQLEEAINELVYQLYGLDEHDKAVIEDFLKKF